MRSVVITFVGEDRTGIVDRIAEVVAAHDGNWEASRLARLGGRFAGILSVTVPAAQLDPLSSALHAVEGLTLVVDEPHVSPDRAPVRHFSLTLTGADHPGIVRDVSRVLASLKVNVEELHTGVESAPMSGEALFRATAELAAAPSVELTDIAAALEAIADDLVVDLDLRARS